MMKRAILTVIDKTARRAAESLTLARKRGDSFDVLEVAFLKAAYESAEFYEEHLITSEAFGSDLELLSRSVELAPKTGLFVEFGVASGRTISHMAGLTSSTLYGFDSFEGLPEAWRSGFDKGAFARNLPPVPGNVELIKGWFDETLPKFLAEHPEPLALLHVDCDLYSSTKTIFDLLGSRLRPGSVIVFDEYWNYPGWKLHEYKAFEEMKAARGLTCKPIGFVPSHQQVAFAVE
jgi:hypothetical protein